MNTVRNRILNAIVARYEGEGSWIGKVIDACETSNVDADVAATLKGGKVVVELNALSDVSLRQDGIDAGWAVDAFRFDVIALLYLPAALLAGKRPSEVGADFHGRLVALATAGDNQTWGGLALKTEVLGGGGVGFPDETGRIVTVEHAITVTYRHTRGNPEEAR